MCYVFVVDVNLVNGITENGLGETTMDYTKPIMLTSPGL